MKLSDSSVAERNISGATNFHGVRMRSQITEISEILDATSPTELLLRLQLCARAVGLEHCAFVVEAKRPTMPTQLSVVNDYPQEFQTEYAQKRFALIDPTLVHRQSNGKPLVWSEDLYTSENKHLWETARSFGIGHGFSIPIHDAMGNVACLLSGARDRKFEAKELLEVLPLAKIMAACAHTVASLRITPTLLNQTPPKLTTREKEILQYLSIGKTTWDISTIFSISEAAVLFHVKNLVRKMDASNRTHAAVKAMAYGLIN